MTPKTIKILYWVFTLLFVLANLFGGIVDLMMPQSAKDIMTHLGYPLYVLTILGVAKILGSIAIIQNKYKTVKEWAYSGFLIDFIGAAASMIFVGDPIMIALSGPLIFTVVMFLSYYFWKKMEHKG